jgi:hypothetical protein
VVSSSHLHFDVPFVWELDIFVGITELYILNGRDERVVDTIGILYIATVGLVVVATSVFVRPINLHKISMYMYMYIYIYI